MDGEDQDEDGPDDERGEGQHAEGGAVGGLVEEAVGAPGGLDGHGHGDGDGHELGEDDQLEIDRERLRNDAHRRLMGGEGLAQVALEDVADPDEVLLPERLVETELVVEDRRVLRGVVRPEDGDGGVAR